MVDPDVMKEYLRDAFMDGALDLGGDRKFLEGFIRIFAGEMESIIAIDHATYLSRKERAEMLKLARPTRECASHFEAWRARISGPSRKPDLSSS